MSQETEEPLLGNEIEADSHRGIDGTSEKSGREIYGYSVVGIGASAGGLQALRDLLSPLPHDSGLVFVVIMHLSPQHESRLAELLQPHTAMPVSQVTERTRIEPDHVYIIPPARNLLVKDGHLDPVDLDPLHDNRMRIDDFFHSLAEEHGDGVAIILSGSGSDGAEGIQRVKERGGLIFAQDPEEAEFDGMPKSAIATGQVDVVAPVAELAQLLVAAKHTLARLDLPDISQDLTDSTQRTLTSILEYLHEHTGHNFHNHKEATIRRRIARRMQLANTPTLAAYLKYLRGTPGEADNLFGDLLIHVTEFFRDPEAWQYLETNVIPSVFAEKTHEDTVRAWVAGCASDEEVYSLVMLVVEHAATLSNPPKIQIFASDLGERALDQARLGVYPSGIAANVSKERLSRFFEAHNGQYRIRKDLREMVLFSTHNLLQDPPFSQLDLVLCRNVLIYLQHPAQEQAFKSFHYALRPDGYLFLGSAESADDVPELFEPVYKSHRIYRRSRTTRHRIVLPALASSIQQPQVRPQVAPPRADSSPAHDAAEHLRGLEEVGLPSLLVSDQYVVLHYSETVGRYLQHPGGLPTQDVIRLIRPELQAELLGALHHAFAEGKSMRTRPIPVKFNGDAHPVTVLVRPLPGQGQALILFWEEEADELEYGESIEGEDALSSAGRAHQLELELRAAQQHLQVTHEQFEASAEELRAANEELQSTNEEYRATLEELETGKEELQSMNEELHTVNHELKEKVEEVISTNSDLQNLLASTEIATLFLDRQLCVKRYTPRVAKIFNLMASDMGRPISHLRRTINYPELESDAQKTLSSLIPIEREVEDQAGDWFLVTLRPYRTIRDTIEGVVLTFVDITLHKEIEKALEKARHFSETVVKTILDSVLVLDNELCVRSANDSFYTNFQLTPHQVEGRLIYEVGDGMWNLPELHSLLNDVLPEENAFATFQLDHTFKELGPRSLLLNGRQVDGQDFIALTITDITNLQQSEQRVAELSATQRIHEISSRLLLETNFDKLLDEILAAAVAILGADMGNLQMLDPETKEIFLRSQVGFEDEFLKHFDRIGPDSTLCCTQAINQSQRIILSDIADNDLDIRPENKSVLERAGVRAIQSTPLISRGGQTVGVLSTHWRQPHTPGDNELRLFDLLVRQAADLIERARTEQMLQEWAETLETSVENRTQQVQALAGEILRIEQRVQQRLAVALHDDLQQQLYGARMHLELVRQDLEAERPQNLQASLTVLDEMLGTMLDLTRQLTQDLAPPTLHSDDLQESLQWLVKRNEEMYDLKVHLDVQDNPPVPHEIAVLIYHCARELLFNVVKHAHVQEAAVEVRQMDQHLHIIIQDHGRGFEAGNLKEATLEKATGYGLLYQRERLTFHGAELQLDSAPNKGTTARIIVPLTPEKALQS